MLFPMIKESLNRVGRVGQIIGNGRKVRFIQEAPLQLWTNFLQRALDTTVAGINKKTDLNVKLEALERSGRRRVTALVFAIRARAMPTLVEKESVRAN
jgi:exonuclease I